MLEMEESFGPLEPSTLAEYERKWNVELPPSYRAFLLKFNGGSPVRYIFCFKNSDNGSDLRFFLGITPGDDDIDIQEHLEVYAGRLPKRFFPIGYDSGGNLICISTAAPDSGKIYFWDHEMEADRNQGQSPETVDNTILIADDFDEFLNGLKERQTA